MAGVDCIIKRSKIASCDGGTTRRCIASISEEIVFNILVCLPAKVIYVVMRYVCRKWYNIIHSPIFISSHLQKSTIGLFVQRHVVPETGYFVKTTKCNIEVKELKFQFAGIAVTSCNGLVLFNDYKSWHALYVANPVTKQQVSLPPFPGRLSPFLCGFAYAASSRVYKVVHCIGLNYGCAILTIGDDEEWRFIDINQLTSTTAKAFVTPPLSLGGFVHWANPRVQFVLSLDVETETFRQIPHPQGYDNESLTFLAMGSSLSFMLLRDKYIWEVWVLKDPKTGEWAKLPDLDLQGQRCLLEGTYCSPESRLRPVGWLQSGELVVFRVSFPSRNWIVYNFNTGGIHSFELDNSKFLPHQKSYAAYTICASHAHVNSLVPLNSFVLR